MSPRMQDQGTWDTRSRYWGYTVKSQPLHLQMEPFIASSHGNHYRDH
jgi:hypothetical protein